MTPISFSVPDSDHDDESSSFDSSPSEASSVSQTPSRTKHPFRTNRRGLPVKVLKQLLFDIQAAGGLFNCNVDRIIKRRPVVYSTEVRRIQNKVNNWKVRLSVDEFKALCAQAGVPTSPAIGNITNTKAKTSNKTSTSKPPSKTPKVTSKAPAVPTIPPRTLHLDFDEAKTSNMIVSEALVAHITKDNPSLSKADALELITTIRAHPFKPFKNQPFLISSIENTLIDGKHRQGLQFELNSVDPYDIVEDNYKAFLLSNNQTIFVQVPTLRRSTIDDETERKKSDGAAGTWNKEAHDCREVAKNNIIDNYPFLYYAIELSQDVDRELSRARGVSAWSDGTAPLQLCGARVERKVSDSTGLVVNEEEFFSVYWRIIFNDTQSKTVKRGKHGKMTEGEALLSKLAGTI